MQERGILSAWNRPFRYVAEGGRFWIQIGFRPFVIASLANPAEFTTCPEWHKFREQKYMTLRLITAGIFLAFSYVSAETDKVSAVKDGLVETMRKRGYVLIVEPKKNSRGEMVVVFTLDYPPGKYPPPGTDRGYIISPDGKITRMPLM